METAWIQIFVMTLTQCIAPVGKMVCQEESVKYQFAAKADCESALLQMLDVAARVDNVIVVRDKSHCRAMSSQVEVFANSSAAGERYQVTEDDGLSLPAAAPPDFTRSQHEERLKNLHNCDEVAGVAPCKIGDIIIEAADDNTRKVEIWRRDN